MGVGGGEGGGEGGGVGVGVSQCFFKATYHVDRHKNMDFRHLKLT